MKGDDILKCTMFYSVEYSVHEAVKMKKFIIKILPNFSGGLLVC